MRTGDIISMTTFGSQPYGGGLSDIDVATPDGRLRAVVVKRGDLAQNTNIFALLLFHTDQLFHAPRPDTLLTLASASNRPAISHLKWLADNHTLAFLGERSHELPQVYTLDVRTRALTARTQHPTEITSYDIGPTGDPVVYSARPAVDTSRYAAMRQRGFALRSTKFVGDLLRGAWADAAGEASSFAHLDLLIWHTGVAAPVAAQVPGPSYRWCNPRSVSIGASGHRALIQCERARAPVRWKEYTEPYLSKFLRAGDDAVLAEFAVLDLDQGTVTPLVDAPVLYGATVQWSPSDESVVLANAFLPLDGTDLAERRVRAARRGIAEVDVRTGRVTVVAHRDSLDVLSWDAHTNTVEFVAGIYGTGALDGPRVRYRKTAKGWHEVDDGRLPSHPVLVVEQGLNRPPRLVAVDRTANWRAVLFDPNPQLGAVHLGHEAILRWSTRSGRAGIGGLYYPPDFAPGRRYPLVIQTHGFDSTAFQPDGIYPTANAAQPMAAAGMLVLQVGVGDVPSAISDLLTPREAPHAMEDFEGAIDHLDSLGLIDRSRVGLIGFSRTCFHVLYTLTHSRYQIAAAAVTDGIDYSYLQYLIFENARRALPSTLDEYTPVNGGPPLGRKLDIWRERAPGFNLDRVTAPLRLEAIGLGSVLSEWEPYAGLLLQHKPAELFVIPDGSHLLVKPWERMASSQGNADWFRFWLKGEEDPDPAKAEQYARWRELRKLQQEQTPGDTAASEHKVH